MENVKDGNDEKDVSGEDFDFMLWKAGLSKGLLSFWNTVIDNDHAD